MKAEVAGVPLKAFEEPIYHALLRYSDRTGGDVVFDDLPNATELELTPDKPNSARSSVTVRYMGKVASTLYVIAFAPSDGTGDENTLQLSNINVGHWPKAPKMLPRSKEGIHSEAHLTIASALIDQPNADLRMYAGNLDLFGLDRDHPTWLRKISEVGQYSEDFKKTMQGKIETFPHVTYTVGEHSENNHNIHSRFEPGERFGDPHSVYNPHQEVVQVCAFLAVTDALAEEHKGIFNALRAYEPTLSLYL